MKIILPLNKNCPKADLSIYFFNIFNFFNEEVLMELEKSFLNGDVIKQFALSSVRS